MNMYTRQASTYDYDPKVVRNILGDDVNPLNRIGELISNHSNVLDIGAGSGLLPVVLVAKNKTVSIDGIEPDPYASRLAQKNYSAFWTGTVEEYKSVIDWKKYDYIVLADVIEHLQDPFMFLNILSSLIHSGTRIILSVPNVAFGAVRLNLLRGNFRYVDSGILEKTHLRFFTLESLQQLVSNAGFATEKLYYLQRDIFSTDKTFDIVDFNFFTVRDMMNDVTAFTYQFLMVLSHDPNNTEYRTFGNSTKSIAKKYFIALFVKYLNWLRRQQ